MLATATLPVGVVVERHDPASRWAEDHWLPAAVLPEVPEAAPWTSLGRLPAGERFYAGAAAVVLYSTHTANYRDNLATGAPKLWVMLRAADGMPPVAVAAVTADPAEGEAFTEPGTDIVETVPMPPAVAARIGAFVAAHHVERDFFKRRRDDPHGRRAAGLPEDEE